MFPLDRSSITAAGGTYYSRKFSGKHLEGYLGKGGGFSGFCVISITDIFNFQKRCSHKALPFLSENKVSFLSYTIRYVDFRVLDKYSTNYYSIE